MPILADLPGVVFALLSALAWGGGDFNGGLAARRHHPFQVLALSSLSGIALLLVLFILWDESLPPLRSLAWATVAGGFGAIGIAMLYHALSTEQMASVAPLAAVIGVTLAVGFGMLTEGIPQTIRLVGFALALLGIWWVSQSSAMNRALSRKGLLSTCLSGACFGIFFIAMAQIGLEQVFAPLIVARLVSFLMALLLIRIPRLRFPPLTSNPKALLAGALDTLGNLFYLLATQSTRLDIAAVLSSLYPAVTVFLAYFLLRERLSRNQQVGVVVCLTAIVLITV